MAHGEAQGVAPEDDHQRQLLGYLDAVGVKSKINPRLVRGLDYYTRTVFEIVAEEKLGSQDTVCAGGRYDKLVEECGATVASLAVVLELPELDGRGRLDGRPLHAVLQR